MLFIALLLYQLSVRSAVGGANKPDSADYHAYFLWATIIGNNFCNIIINFTRSRLNQRFFKAFSFNTVIAYQLVMYFLDLIHRQ
jgi:hypothetical protein